MPQRPHYWLLLLWLFCWLPPVLLVMLMLMPLYPPARRLPEGSHLAA
jgi:hypothetical protein